MAKSLSSPKWRLKLKSLYKSRSSSISPMSINSSEPSTPDCDFLTPLDNYTSDYFTPLTDRQEKKIGDITLPSPPPPPRLKWELIENESSFLSEKEPSPVSSGPRVKPYFATANNARSGLQGHKEMCFICEESLETTLYSEKLVPLQCGDILHEECLRTVINMELTKKLQDGELRSSSSTDEMMNAVYPKCSGAICKSKHEYPRAVPVHETVLNDLNNDLVLSMKLAHYEAPKTLDPNQNPASVSILNAEPEKALPWPPSRTSSTKVVKTSTTPLRNTTTTQKSLHRSSLVSNTSVGTCATVSVRVNEHSNIDPGELKSAFIKHMISHAPEFDLSFLVSLGRLRLVDELSVSVARSGPFRTKNVYLFSNYLVVWSACDDPSFLMVPLHEEVMISTPIPSVLQVISSGEEGEFNIRLHSDTNSIIEKWCIAIADRQMTFPSNIFSSTMRLPEIVAATAAAVNSKTKISPILESVSDFAPSVPERSPKRSYQGLAVYTDDIPGSDISRPTSPLRLRKDDSSSSERSIETDITDELFVDDKSVASALDALSRTMELRDTSSQYDSEDDSDEDSDCEVIEKVMNSLNS
ncbi:hypothetical_protein [Candidozyma auris]|uniref:hypothetical_protein n=1 Tax=Candidozyma auris TaxID=498019 RepID=UPI000D26768E|nr:hypothetical_protein [[Candida] auris]QEO22392.1 hypothetical_protein [[Candida] auris]GBL51199.1 hypothetical protein CAJCM15448_34730 [[Candida] auris]